MNLSDEEIRIPEDPMNIETHHINAINEVALLAYSNAFEKKFHDGDGWRSDVDNFSKWTANLHGEVSELWEAARKGTLNKPCDKDCGLTCAEEELADIVIRAFDTATAFGISIGDAIAKKHAYNQGREKMHGGKLA